MRFVSFALAALIELAACHSTPLVHLASDPPGAQVLVDDEDSGFVTPCVMALPNTAQRIDFLLPGYATATRYLARDVRAEIVLWNDMLASYNTWHFPLWLNYRDFFIPIEKTSGPFPTRLFVRMRRPNPS
jgi:PEGA domain